MGLQEEILNEALANKVCEKFRKELESGELTQDQLCMMYHRGLDFCIEHNFPSRNIVDKFDEETLHRNGIFYDYKGRFVSHIPFVVVNGDSDIELMINSMSSVYVRGNAKVRLVLKRNSFVYVSTYDNSSVEIVGKGEKAQANASVFGGNIVNKEMFDQIHYKKED